MANIRDFFDKMIMSIEGIGPDMVYREEESQFIPKVNIVDQIDDRDLYVVGNRAMEGYESDRESMANWEEYVEDGVKLAMPENKPKNTPFENASNFKSPLLLTAVYRFADAVSTEMLRPDDLVVAHVSGESNEQREEIAKAYAEYANYQINHEMTEWREEQEKVIYDLPLVGSCFKKVFFNSDEQKMESRLITYPNFAVNNNCDSMARLRRFSEVIYLTKNEVEERVRAGLWAPIPMMDNDEDMEGVEYDQYQKFIEQQGWADLDNDGYEEPYNFVVHCDSRTVVQVTPRYEYSDITFNGDEVVKIKPTKDLVKYGFLKDPEGGFLDIGYAHLLGATTKAVNTTANQLIDAGKIANVQGGFLARGFKKAGDIRVTPGRYIQTDMMPDQLKNSVLPYTAKEPSPTLFQLMEMMVQSAQELASSTNIVGAVGANAPATTTLSLLTEQNQSRSAIVMRIYRAMTEEFKLIYELNKKYIDPQEYMDITGMQPMFDDFVIQPNANPDVSSKVLRLQQAATAMQAIPDILQSGGDAKPVIRNFLDAINFSDADEVVPEQTPDQQLAELLQRNPQLEAMILGEQERAMMMQQAQLEMAQQEQAREDAKLQAELSNKEADTLNKLATAAMREQEAELREIDSDINQAKAPAEIDNAFLTNQKIISETKENNRENRGAEYGKDN